MKRWLAMLVVACASCLRADGASEIAKLVFGENDASKDRIEKGALFIDGLYIRGPYTVTREGNLILVNGKTAARLRVEAEEPAADATEADAADEDAADEDAADEDAADEAVEAVVSPQRRRTREDEAAAAKERADEMRKRSGHKTLAEKEEERKKARAPKAKPAFNQEVVSSNPDALFEEADYTYTPPSRAEPKPVPYIRPEAKKSLTERLKDEAVAKSAKAAAAEAAREADASETVAAAQPEQPSMAEITAAEDALFETLTEDKVNQYIEALNGRQKEIEVALQRDQLVFLSSSTVAWKASSKSVMQRFMLSLEKVNNLDKFLKTWRTLPQGYLRSIYKHRSENSKNSKTLRLRIQREQRAAKDKPRRV